MRNLLGLVGLLAIVPCVVGGCVLPLGEKQVLAGTWQATGSPFPLTTFLVFDSAGNLDQMITRAADNVEITDDLIGTQTSVVGNQVTFYYSIPLIGTRSFTGTLNGDNTVITGQMTTTIRVLLSTITTEEGDVTLTRTTGP